MEKSVRSIELYNTLKKRGYPLDFCEAITSCLNTDFTAKRMLGYLTHYKNAPLEQIVDEMLAILSDRDHIMQKKTLESTNAKWNVFLNKGRDMFADDDQSDSFAEAADLSDSSSFQANEAHEIRDVSDDEED